jgi:hypothetical protein
MDDGDDSTIGTASAVDDDEDTADEEEEDMWPSSSHV